MMKFRSLICLWCLLLLVFSLGSAQTLQATGYDTETVSRKWEENAFFTRMAEMTGVDVQGHAITEEKEYTALLNGLMAGEAEADILFKANLTREMETALYQNGAIVNLAPYIEENMPNLSALLAEHPQWREQISLEDGAIASLPFINMQERQVCAWINVSWLEKLGLQMPSTMEELTAALQAIAAGDPNANGKKDENAVDLIGVYEMRWLLPFFGIVADDYNVCRDDSGNLAFAPEQAGYREFVETLKSWYDLGLMRSDAFTASHTALQIASSSSSSNSNSSQETVNTSGLIVSITPYTMVDVDQITSYEALLIPAADGKIHWRDLLGDVWTGTFAVTNQCGDIPAALRWVDALYGEAGALLAYIGVEGEDYFWNKNGYWEYMLDDSRDIEDIRAKTIIYTGVTIPGLYPAGIIEQVDSEADRWVFAQSEKVHPYSERVLSNYFLTADVKEEAEELSTVLGNAVDVGIARFITGELPLDDAHWTSWLDELKTAGSGRLVELLSK